MIDECSKHYFNVAGKSEKCYLLYFLLSSLIYNSTFVDCILY